MACQALTSPVTHGSLNTASLRTSAAGPSNRNSLPFHPLQHQQSYLASRQSFRQVRQHRPARIVCSAAEGSNGEGGDEVITRFTEDLKQRAADFAESAKLKAAELAEETQAKAADLAEEAKRYVWSAFAWWLIHFV